MTDERAELRRLGDELKTIGDELRLKMHLAKAEARDEFENLERRLDHARGRLVVIGGEAREVTKDVLRATREVLDEIKTGYQRVRRLM
jgi:hypothetical protein